MMFIPLILAAVQMIGQMKQGEREGEALQQQADLQRLQTRGEAVRHRQQANAVLRRSMEAQAVARARAAAGGVDAFSGSAGLVQEISARDGSTDFGMSMDNARLAELTGFTQALNYEQAGRSARNRGLLGGLMSGGSAAVRFGGIGSAPSGGLVQEQAPGQWSTVNPQYG